MVGFLNVTSLPLAFVQYVIPLVPTIFLQKFAKMLVCLLISLNSDEDTVQTLVTKGEAYVLFYTLFESLLRWTLAYKLLQNDEPVSFTETEPSNKLMPEILLTRQQYQEIPDNVKTFEDKSKIWQLIKKVKSFLSKLTNPMWASVFAILVGITPMKSLFYESGTNLFSSQPIIRYSADSFQHTLPHLHFGLW